MEETKIEITNPEPEKKEPEEKAEPGAAAAAAAAEEHKEETKENKEESKEAAEESKEAAAAAAESKKQTENLTSYNQSVIKGLVDSMGLVVTRVEQVMGIVKEMAQDFRQVNEELRTTTELHQEQIGEIDAAANKIVTAAAALVKVHKQMNEQQ